MSLLTFHLTTLAVTAVAILYADHLGYQYFTGKRAILDLKVASRLHSIVWLGLLIMILSGALLTVPYVEYWFSLPLFYVKIGLVLILVLNSIAIGRLYPLTSRIPFRDLSRNMQVTFLTSGVISFTCWVGTALLSFFFF